MPDEKEKPISSPSLIPPTPRKEGFSVPEPNATPPENPLEHPDPFTKSHKDFPLKENGDGK